MLTTTSKISDQRLEPNDQTVLFVTVKNTNAKATAKNVKATVNIGNVKGVQLTPDDRDFGQISPCSEVTKEFSIVTECATPKPYDVQIKLSYDYSFPTYECEKTRFLVCAD